MGNIFSDNPALSVTAIIGLFGIFATHRLLVYRENRRRFNDAGIHLRETLNPFLSEIDSGLHGFGNPISDEIIRRHHTAYLNFSTHLRGVSRKQYNETWDQYCFDCQNIGERGLITRITTANIKKDIESLLDFVEYKPFRGVFIFWKRLFLAIQWKVFGPDKETTEIAKKFLKIYHK